MSARISALAVLAAAVALADRGKAVDYVVEGGGITEDFNTFFYSGAAVSIEWTGRPEYFSMVEYSDDLRSWTPVGAPVQEANGATSSAIPAGALGTGKRFFRIVRSRP